MVKIVPFINTDVQLEPIVYSGLDFVYNPNQIIGLKNTDPLSLFNQLSHEGYNWYFDFSDTQKNESKIIKVWHDVSFAARVSRAFKEEKPIVLFDDEFNTRGLNQKEISDLMNKIVSAIKSKKVVSVVEDEEKLVIE